MLKNAKTFLAFCGSQKCLSGCDDNGGKLACFVNVGKYFALAKCTSLSYITH
jgi:hypothetical protein